MMKHSNPMAGADYSLDSPQHPMRRDSTFATSLFSRKRTNQPDLHQVKGEGLSATTSDTSRPPPASSTTHSRPGAQYAPRWVRTLFACTLPPADALALWDVLLLITRQLPRSG